MNDQDRWALGTVTDIGSSRFGDAHAHISARLDYTDKLERALAWFLKADNIDNGVMLVVSGPIGWVAEYHDGTPRGRGEALVRLWERVTGGQS